jgi:hypothetical protein
MAIEAYNNQIAVNGVISTIHESNNGYASWGKHIELSDTKVLATYLFNLKSYVVVGNRIDACCIEWGTPVEFLAASASRILPIRMSDTKFLIGYVDGSADGWCIAGTISGTVPTLGTAVEFKDADTIEINGLEYVGTDKAIVTYANTTTMFAKIVSLSSTTITYGAEATVGSGTNLNNYLSVKQVAVLSTTLAVAVYYVSGTNTECVTLSISGTSITVNTAGKASLYGGSQDIRYPIIWGLSSTVFNVAYNDASSTNKGYIQQGTISGTTITLGGAETAFDAENLDGRVTMVAPISGYKVAIIYTDSNSQALHYKAVDSSSPAGTENDLIGMNDAHIYQWIAIDSGWIGGFTYNATYDIFLVSTVVSQGSQNYIFGMFAVKPNYSYYEATVVPMLHKIAETGSTEQIELSSVYFANFNLSSQFTETSSPTLRGILSLDGTSPDNYVFVGGSEMDSNSYTKLSTLRIPLANCPIVLKPNQKLYAGLSKLIKTIGTKATVTVFGLKRTTT